MTHSFPSRCSSDLLEFHATILSLVRTDGQDTRRSLASVQWDMRKDTPMGQVVTLTGFARGDVYQTEQSALTANALYRGEEGWQTRGIAAAAVDISWPLAGPALGGIQTLTPRIQFVGSPGTSNLSERKSTRMNYSNQ